MRVAAVTSGRKIPSSRFRVRQYVESLAAAGVTVHEFVPFVDKYASWSDVAPSTPRPLRRLTGYAVSAAKVLARAPALLGSRVYDLCWLEREMIPGRLTMERLLPHPLVFDIDDAIWLLSGRASGAINAIAGRAEIVLAGNDYIATHLSDVAKRVEVVPTGVDVDYFSPAPREPGRLRIGWVGSVSNVAYLESLERALYDVTEMYDAELVVVADRRPDLPSLGSRLSFREWTEESEVDAIRRFDIGLMPLRNDEWSRGKCGLKLLQYMACGVPPVASPVGVAKGILAEGGGLAAESDSDWRSALGALAADPDRRRAIAESGRSAVIRRYSHDALVPRLVSIFRSVVR